MFHPLQQGTYSADRWSRKGRVKAHVNITLMVICYYVIHSAKWPSACQQPINKIQQPSIAQQGQVPKLDLQAHFRKPSASCCSIKVMPSRSKPWDRDAMGCEKWEPRMALSNHAFASSCHIRHEPLRLWNCWHHRRNKATKINQVLYGHSAPQFSHCLDVVHHGKSLLNQANLENKLCSIWSYSLQRTSHDSSQIWQNQRHQPLRGCTHACVAELRTPVTKITGDDLGERTLAKMTGDSDTKSPKKMLVTWRHPIRNGQRRQIKQMFKSSYQCWWM